MRAVDLGIATFGESEISRRAEVQAGVAAVDDLELNPVLEIDRSAITVGFKSGWNKM